jgi:hypothetical protein
MTFLPSVGNLAFLLFGKGARVLLLSEAVGSTGPLCSLVGKPPGTKKWQKLEPEVHLGLWWQAPGIE